ncbi:aminotransferase class V-fold PLP-dependent enzyme [Parasedimentitalea maritima]|uniref:Aminotransferase class V-fold PLP-dependent enzyme n=1 Tax=Parasedimentitalea maritima TaxID=2578117 RepID=A0ABY2UTJ2_9RHOB|nr:aminotransferase class V-fold PLP-dependent enzyme [Zongyanglinia marina]TLP61376.1 aminotransferase class V-fold PLP-dependent enzyme [Zongyanglinia marina]
MTNAPNAPDGSGYLLYHSIGQYHGKAKDSALALAEFAGFWGATNDEHWANVLPKRQEFIDGWRHLINAPEGTLTTSENVTASLYSLIGALPEKYLKGKRVLVAADCFPSLHFMLSGISERLGFSLDTVPMRQGASWVEDEDMLASWGPDVGLALLTWVSSTSSHKIDLEPLVAHGRKMGSLIGVDITQAAGLLPFDVMAPEIDFTVSTSLKWLCGTPGAGILYVANELTLECEPGLRGWFSQPDPFSWELDKFEYAPDSRRFDHGTPGMVANIASLPALKWHAAQNREELVAHNHNLTSQIIDVIDDLNLNLCTPRSASNRGGSIMVKLPPEMPAAHVLNTLKTNHIYADARGQTLRLSPGFVTTSDGINALHQSLKAV